MTVETDIQLLRNMKKGMWTVVIAGVQIQWLLESGNDEEVLGVEMENGVRIGGV